MNFLIQLLKAVPYLFALTAISAALLIGMAGIRILQHKMDQTSLILGIAGLMCLIIAFVLYKTLPF